MCVCFIQLVGKRYPLKAVRILEEKKNEKKKQNNKKKIIPFRQNLLESIRPFSEPTQFYVLGVNLSYAEAPERGGGGRAYTTRGETL